MTGGGEQVDIGGHFSPLSLLLTAGAGMFLISRNTPYWLRVSLASFWKRRELIASAGKRREGGLGGGPFTIVSALPFPARLPTWVQGFPSPRIPLTDRPWDIDPQ